MGRTVVRAGTALLAVSLALVGVGCGSSDDSASTSSGSATAAASTQPAGNTAAADDGKVYKVVLPPMFTGNTFLPGHRIRVQISSSNFPRYDRNLNTGVPGTSSTEMVPAMQTIHRSAPQPSHIVLPVVH